MDLQTFTELGSGLFVSLEIFFLTLLFSLPLGMVVAFGRMSKKRILSAVTKFYISVMRGTPLMLQLIVVYFGPYYLFRIRVGADYRFIAVILAFVLNYAAYFAEIYRSGLQAMPKGQYEAAKVLGYSKTQTFFHIILPQLIKQVLPAVTNEIIAGQGHFAGLCDRCCGNVHYCQAAGGCAGHDRPADDRRAVLLCVQPHCQLRHGAH